MLFLSVRHHHQSIRFAGVRRHLGHQFGARDADGNREPALPLDTIPDFLGHCYRSALPAFQTGRVHKGLVYRERLHRGRVIGQDAHHSRRFRLVLPVTASHEDAVGTETPRPCAGHGRMDAIRTRFIGSCRYDPASAGAADHNRLAAQRGVIPLLDCGKERIKIGMNDPARGHCTLHLIIS